MKQLIKQRFRFKLLITFLVFTVHSCQKPHPIDTPMSDADVVYQWYKFVGNLQRPVNPQPVVFVQARAFAYIGIGLFESVLPGIKGGSSFSGKLYEMPAMPKADMSKRYLWSASANAALASMFKQFLASLSAVDRESIDAKEVAIYNQLKLSAPEDVLKRSEAFGRSIANAVYNWSASDNFSVTSGNYKPLNEPWSWAPTVPSFAPAAGDNLQFSRPFLRYTLTAKVPPIPVSYSASPSSAFYKAAREVYDLGGVTTASPEQKATANWWADAGGVNTGLPAPYHLLSIVTSVLESRQANLWKAAEMYAKTGISFKDGAINTFRAKYQYNLLRPITYIHQHIDPTWLSHLANPPYPDYPSGLVGFYGPLIQVLIREFGDIPVTDDCYAFRNLPARYFSSLSQLRAEACVSRVYAGIHYRFTQDASLNIGIDLGNEIHKIQVMGSGHP